MSTTNVKPSDGSPLTENPLIVEILEVIEVNILQELLEFSSDL
jgi:hypothetical protein